MNGWTFIELLIGVGAIVGLVIFMSRQAADARTILTERLITSIESSSAALKAIYERQIDRENTLIEVYRDQSKSIADDAEKIIQQLNESARLTIEHSRQLTDEQMKHVHRSIASLVHEIGANQNTALRILAARNDADLPDVEEPEKPSDDDNGFDPDLYAETRTIPANHIGA